MTLPSCGGPSGGGDLRIAEIRVGRTEVTLALYVYYPDEIMQVISSDLHIPL